jgi:hypothetical protein
VVPGMPKETSRSVRDIKEVGRALKICPKHEIALLGADSEGVSAHRPLERPDAAPP